MGIKSFFPAIASSHCSLKYSNPFAVDSIITIVSGVLGTACIKPINVFFLSPVQKANSDICNLLIVLDLPIPFPPAVNTFILLFNPVPSSLSKTNSFALLFFFLVSLLLEVHYTLICSFQISY